MDDPNSRYKSVGTAIWRSPEGKTVHYRLRRFLPDDMQVHILAEVTVRDGQRLDQIAAAQLGNPLQWWRIADANRAMDPFELTSESGRVLIVPVPKP